MMEKRVMLAAAVSVAFLALYTKLVIEPQAKRAPVQPRQVEAGPAATPLISSEETSLHPIDDEQVISIGNDSISLRIGSTTANIHSASLASKQGLVEVASRFPLLHAQLPSGQLDWKVRSTNSASVEFEAEGDSGSSYALKYSLSELPHVVDITFSTTGQGEPKGVITTSWAQTDSLSSSQNPLEMVASGPKNGGTWYQKHGANHKTGKNVPRGTFLVVLSERYFCQGLRHLNDIAEVKLLGSSPGTIAAESLVDLRPNGDSSGYRGRLYLGPRDYFYLKQANFADAFKVGVMGQIGLILILVLNWLAAITGNYGVAIVLLSALVSASMAPFTLVSMRSMKKMQALKPEMDRIMAKHKQNPTKGNQEVMALYKEHKVSPLSGCLPMLLQLPIFIALLQAITHFIGFRGAGFLWIKDLSLPDRAFILPSALPFLGDAINVLPLAMAGLMYFQTKMSQQSMGAQSNSQMPNIMAGPVMPIIFGVMFYQFPSALVLYWLTNSAISIATYRLVR